MEEQNRDIYLNFLFYKVDPLWRRLSTDEKEQGIKEFAAVAKGYSPHLKLRPYSTVGFRSDSDFLLWLIGHEPESIQNLVADLYRTGLGKYLSIEHAFFSMRRANQYAANHPQAFELELEPTKYLIVYPFVKSREWYQLPFEQRKEMMLEHQMIGHGFSRVRLNTAFSFGLSDQDFVVAFDTDYPGDFQELVMKLREIRASKYTVRDTPMCFCVSKSLEDTLRDLG